MKKLILPAVVSLLALWSLPGHAAEPVAMRVVGTKSGQIQGSGPEGAIVVLACEHEVISPRDAASGLPTGKRQHKPFVITKETDKSTPLLYQSLVTNENLTSVELKYYRPGPAGGGPQLVYTVKLVNASIASIRHWKPSTKDPATVAGDFAEYEEIAFTYQKIEWTWAEGGATATDDWEAMVQ